MSYNPTQWSAGDTVTSAKLNKMEQGISNSGVLEIHAVISNPKSGVISLDKTWQEIYNANNSVIMTPSGSEEFPMRTNVINVGYNGLTFVVLCFIDGTRPMMFSAETPNDYPTLLGNPGNQSMS